MDTAPGSGDLTLDTDLFHNSRHGLSRHGLDLLRAAAPEPGES